MGNDRSGGIRRLMCGAAAAALLAGAGAARAQDQKSFDIAPQPLASALYEFGEQSGHQVLFKPALTDTKVSSGVSGASDQAEALTRILAGTGLSFRKTGDVYLILDQREGGSSPQGAGAGDVDALIVTAQKREENIQDVPIAISAFSQEDLTRSQVAGGPDLMTQVPNMTFTKTNFSSYSIQIRGIGTQAISATTDPAVAVAFNNTPFVRNRFFEQEFYDLQRIEVLRGPQGTLYGRNATAGVVNILSAKPKFVYEAKASADVASYNSTRIEGMVNIPVVEDLVALRLAGAWTKRDGFVTNEITGNPIDGRDLWSTRLSLRISPNDRIDANLVWEHFEEDDDRLRSGKQLCKKDLKTEIAGVPVPPFGNSPGLVDDPAAIFSQGCVPASLYSPDSFETPNGYSLPYYQPLSNLGLPVVDGLDPYLSTVQSRDLRVIESTVDPEYRSTSDLFQLQVDFDLSDGLTLTSETAYNADVVFSMQDFNRFNTAPGAFDQAAYDNLIGTENYRPGLLENGFFCDPQLGCSDRLVAVDVSTAKSRQFSQELRLSSDFDGPFNFSLGANYLRYDTEDKYYVFINTLSMVAASGGFQVTGGVANQLPTYEGGVSDNHECLGTVSNGWQPGFYPGDPTEVQFITPCIYIDPNPIGALNDLGHNYFLSRNPYKLISYAAFGEVYYQVADNLKITGGLRWTVDKKEAPRIPSWLLATSTVGYPVLEVVEQEWREPTGRLTIDWKPDLGFTDETMVYASYARGYKAGGANPPPTAIIIFSDLRGGDQVLLDNSLSSPKTFDAEYVNAFEVGTKNTLFDGAMTLNLNAFYYDYKGYQISQIVDRSASNLNFDAEVWGAELEVDWRPLENLKLGFKGGYENTRVADGMKAIDLMDRANGGLPDENGVSWIVARPFPTVPSNCILPVWLVTYGDRINVPPARSQPNDGPCALAYLAGLDPVTEFEYEPNPQFIGGDNTRPLEAIWAGYPGFDPDSAPNNGQGFFKDLSGNELPNAPHFTATLTADYTVPLPNEWLMTLHTDLYYQSEAWTRIFNMEGYDKLKAYSNINFAAIFTNEESGWNVMAYVKNVLDRDSITGAFLNSDDTGLTTNVFLTEPRLYGVRVTKAWTGGPLLGSFGELRDGPRPFTVELAGGPNWLDSDAESYAPSWIGLWRPSVPFPLSPMDEDLDTGDDRQVKLTWRPGGLDGWRVTAGVRFGRANSYHQADVHEQMPDTCTLLPFPPYAFCAEGPVDWAWTEARDREEHTLADFTVGRDVGLGAFGEGGESAFSVALRYADFKSRSTIDIISNPDFYFDPGDFFKYERNWHHFDTEARMEREFRGVGPILSWEASSRLLGGGTGGAVNIDWSVTGGVLFGKQKTTAVEDTTGREITGAMIDQIFGGPEDSYVHTIDESVALRTASQSASVPIAGFSLGLSYDVDRFRIGAGYRWERYFDAIDGGLSGEQTYDRTIDGPYFKIAVGFGG